MGHLLFQGRFLCEERSPGDYIWRRKSKKNFAVRFIADANNAFVDFDIVDKEIVREEIEKSYISLHRKLGIAYPPNGKRRVKPMMFESLYSKMGVSGYFGPFFSMKFM